MKWKKFFTVPLWALIVLSPLSLGLMLWAMATLADNHPLCIATYVSALYTLCLWCIRLPRLISHAKALKSKNRYARRWFSDAHLRVKVTLWASVLWNGGYAFLQLGLGIYHRSIWFYALTGYYLTLAAMRWFLVRHTIHHDPGEQMRQELRRYRACGWVFLLLNLALSVMIFLMIRQNRSIRHHEITTITLAAFTFTTLTMAIINVIKNRKFNSPVFLASKAISLASSCVSILTLENTMLTTFGGESMTPETRRLYLALSGGAVSIWIVCMAVYMIVRSNQKLKDSE